MSATIVDYFNSLKRCDLKDINDELRRFCLDKSQTATFAKDGVLVVEDVFGDTCISNALSALDRLELLVENHDTSYQDINLEATGGGFKGQYSARISYTGKVRKVMNLLDHGVEFQEMAMYPPLLRIVTGLLGSDFRLHSKGFLMNKPPGVSNEKPWHQDSAYFNSDSTVITVWIPLQDVEEENACLKAIPGSQAWGTVQHIGSEAQLDLSKFSPEMARSYPVRKGGICIMDKNTAHYSGKNKSSESRRALIFRYEKIGGYVYTSPVSSKGSTSNPLHSFSEKLSLIKDWLQMLGTGSEDEEELCEALKTCQNIEQMAGFIIQRCHRKSAKTSGPAVSSRLMRGENESSIEKTHLITARVCRNIANDKQIKFLDMGTDFSYPFYNVYPPTQAALRALGDNAMEILHYPSSFGLESLRQAFQSFMRSNFGVDLDWKRDIMINTGASQAFDALSRAFEGRYVVLPHLSLPTVRVIATANGAELLRIPSNAQNGMMDLRLAQAEIDRLPPGSVRFLYLNSPLNPTGHVASLDYLQEIVQFASKNSILVVHDMDSWYTHHQRPGRLHNILEVPGAIDCCVTVLSISKEFGLPGLRIGFIAGNSDAINVIRIHNSTFAVMIPDVCQAAAQAALEGFCKGDGKEDINVHVTTILKKTKEGWRNLGWPEEKIHTPSGGFKYLVPIPPGVQPQASFSGVELLDFYITSRANVKLLTSRSFNPNSDKFLRMVLM